MSVCTQNVHKAEEGVNDIGQHAVSYCNSAFNRFCLRQDLVLVSWPEFLGTLPSSVKASTCTLHFTNKTKGAEFAKSLFNVHFMLAQSFVRWFSTPLNATVNQKMNHFADKFDQLSISWIIQPRVTLPVLCSCLRIIFFPFQCSATV